MMNISFNLKTTLSRWLPVVISMAIIFLFSSEHNPYRWLPEGWFGSSGSSGISNEDAGHVAHIFEFALLGFTVLRAMVWKQAYSKRLLLISAVLGMVYALSDEFHQSFVPGRAFQIRDLVFDGLGIAIGFVLFAQVSKVNQKR